MILTKRVMWFFLTLAVANELVWRLTNYNDDIWVNFKTFGMPVLTFAFFILQGDLFKKYPQPSDD
jgi:intracellular septation protein